MMTTPLPPPHHHNSSIPTAWGGLPSETPASAVAATPAVFLPDLPLRSWLFMAGYCALFVLCLVGDIAVAVMVHGLGKRRGGTVYYFVLNLLLADLLIGIFCTPFTLVENTQEDQSLSRVLCRMTPLVEGVVVCGSAFTLAAIAVTRYSQRKHQVSMQAPDVSAKTIAFVLCCIWTIAIAINIPQAFARDLLLTSRPSGEMLTCQETWSNSRAYLLYKGVLVALGFPGPLLFIVFAHVVGATGLSGLKKNQEGTTFKVTVGNKCMHEGRSRDQSTECSEETVISPDRGSNSEERNRLFGGTDGDFMVREGPHKDLSVSSSINETGDINTVACCAGTSCNNCEASKPVFPGGHAGTAWSSPPRVLSADYSLMLPTSSIDTVEVMCSSAPNTLPGEGLPSQTTNSVEQSPPFIPISGTPVSEESTADKTERMAHHCGTFPVSSHLLRALTVLFLITWLPFYTCWALDTYSKLTNTSCKNIHEYFQPISQWIAFSNSLLTPYVSGYHVGCFRLSCFRAKSDKSAAEVETPEEEEREEEEEAEEAEAEEMKTEMEEENPVTWI